MEQGFTGTLRVAGNVGVSAVAGSIGCGHQCKDPCIPDLTFCLVRPRLHSEEAGLPPLAAPHNPHRILESHAPIFGIVVVSGVGDCTTVRTDVEFGTSVGDVYRSRL